MSCPKGQTRNRTTGRCRKKCERHQAVNEATGRCVSKNYLRRVQRRCYGPSDKLCAPYGTGSTKDYRDGLVPDAFCHPRKRNLYTGRCKTPCGPGRAINPATGNCVTLNYLSKLYPGDYDTDDDDDMTAHILFTPTDLSTGLHDNKVTKTPGFHSDTLTENDLTVMKAVHLHHPMAGEYNPGDRKDSACKPPAKTSAFDGAMPSSCGLTLKNPYPQQSTEDEKATALTNMICQDVDMKINKFSFFTSTDQTVKDWVLQTISNAAETCPVRVLVTTYYGVWRFLVPQGENEREMASILATSVLISEVMKKYDEMGHFDSRMLASEVFEAIKARDNMHVSFAPFAEAKSET